MTAGLLSSSTGLASAELDWPISAAWIQFVGVVVTNYIESPKPNFKNPCEMIARATYEHDEKAYTFSRLCTSDIATENGKRFFPREVILEIVLDVACQRPHVRSSLASCASWQASFLFPTCLLFFAETSRSESV